MSSKHIEYWQITCDDSSDCPNQAQGVTHEAALAVWREWGGDEISILDYMLFSYYCGLHLERNRARVGA